MSIKVTFPDGAVRDYALGTTGTTVVEGISKSLAKATVAMKVDGVLSDLRGIGGLDLDLNTDELLLDRVLGGGVHHLGLDGGAVGSPASCEMKVEMSDCLLKQSERNRIAQ